MTNTQAQTNTQARPGVTPIFELIKTYKAVYADGTVEVFRYHKDGIALNEALRLEEKHGKLINLLQIDENDTDILPFVNKHPSNDKHPSTPETDKTPDAAELCRASDSGLTFLTVKDVAFVLDCSVPTAREVMHRADFPLIRVGKKDMVFATALQQWAMQRRD